MAATSLPSLDVTLDRAVKNSKQLSPPLAGMRRDIDPDTRQDGTQRLPFRAQRHSIIRISLFVLAGMLGLALPASPASAESGGPDVSVSGQVTDSSSSPVANASVSASPSIIGTGGDG